MAKEIDLDIHHLDLCLCECGIVDNKDGGLRPTHHLSKQRIYDVVGQWEAFYDIEPQHRLIAWHSFSRPRHFSHGRYLPAPNVSKQQIFEFVRKKRRELWDTYQEYLKQEKYALQHGNLNGYDGTSECEICGAVLTGEAKTAQYAYACGEEGRKIHHLHVGNTHFCNLDCFEKYKAKYNQQLNTPKYED